MKLQSILVVACAAISTISFSQSSGTGEPVEPLLCPPTITSPNWENDPNELFVRCPQVNVGIGTTTPLDRLHITTEDNTGLTFIPTTTNQRSKISFLDEGGNTNWRMTAYNDFSGGYGNIFQLNSEKGGNFWVSNTTMMIGNYFNFDACTDCSDYLLYVRKGIRTEELKVDIASGVWADYVFKPNYQLMPLRDVKSYINLNGHLPNIPSAEEAESEGIKVGEMNAKLLEKVEELTLYIIQQQDEIDELRERLDTELTKAN